MSEKDYSKFFWCLNISFKSSLRSRLALIFEWHLYRWFYVLYRCCSAGTLSSSRPYLLQKIVYFSCEDLSGTRLQILMVERKQYLVTFLLSFEVLNVHLQRACFIPPFLSCCRLVLYIERQKNSINHQVALILQ